VRDIALWTPVGPTRSNIEQDVSAVIAEQGGTLLIKISLFDRFQKPASTQGGEGRTSLAFRLIFQSFERTLTEVEVNQIMEKISTTLRAQGFEIR
jgi:phenylalanyl-tRNA synthetase beta subunit